MDDFNTKASYEISAESNKIEDRLRRTEVGDVVEWKELDELVGFPVRAKRHLYYSAVRRLLNERMHFAVVHSLGVKRLSHSEAAESLRYDLDGVRRKARRSLRKSSKVNADQLTSAEQTTFIVRRTLLAITREAADRRVEQKTLAAPQKRNELTDIRDSIRKMLGK